MSTKKQTKQTAKAKRTTKVRPSEEPHSEFLGEVLISDLVRMPSPCRWWPPTLDGRAKETTGRASIGALARSIKATGFDLHRAVKLHRDDYGDLYVLCGMRRIEAARRTGRASVPAFELVGYSDAELRRIAREDNKVDRRAVSLLVARLRTELPEGTTTVRL